MSCNNLQTDSAVARAAVPSLRLVERDVTGRTATPNRDLYFALSRGTPSPEARAASSDLLRAELERRGNLDEAMADDLPVDFNELIQWEIGRAHV